MNNGALLSKQRSESTWNYIATKYYEFANVQQMLFLFLKDDMSTNMISMATGMSTNAVRSQIIKQKLTYLVRGPGGANRRPCSDELWRFRARALNEGFDNEVQMLKKYRNYYGLLLPKINAVIKKFEKGKPIGIHCLSHRYRRRRIVPARKRAMVRPITSVKDGKYNYAMRKLKGLI